MKQSQQVILLVVLLVIAGIVWSFERNQHTPAIQTANSIQKYKVLAVENPQIRWPELERAQKTEYKSSGRNPFSMIIPPTPAEMQKKESRQRATSACCSASTAPNGGEAAAEPQILWLWHCPDRLAAPRFYY